MRKNVTITVLLSLFLLLGGLASAQDYNEAPMLQQMVQEGKLPPVTERLPEDVYVVEPEEAIGAYGGELRLLTTYSSTPLGVAFVTDAFNGFVNPKADGSDVVPHFAKSIEASDDYTTFTMRLRRGVKWSDGHPYTADDIMFWYEDILLNKELTPMIPAYWQVEGEVVQVNKIDDYTVEFSFPKPQPIFLRMPFSKAPQRDRIIVPKHYLKQFHPNYTPKDELDAAVKEAGYHEWFQLFRAKMHGYVCISDVPGAPVLTPYMPVNISSSRRIFERNPYYWKVDSAGNQLPYIDRVEVDIVSDAQVATAKMLAGDIDFDGFTTSLKDYPLYREAEERGSSYRTLLWQSGNGTEVFFYFNLSHENADKREVFRDVRFRRAMSLAIDRNELNELLYFGQGVIRQFTVLPSSRYFEQEFADAYVDFDPDKAKALLDDMGLVDLNGDGWRDLPNGDKFSFVIEFASVEDPMKTDVVQLVTQHWQEAGINVSCKEISGELYTTRQVANQLECSIWHGGWSTDITFPSANPWVGPGGDYPWPKFADKWQRGDDIGQTIPDEVQLMWDWYEAVRVEPDDQERKDIAKNILRSQAENLWLIGTVGMVPHILIVNKDLGNVPEEGLWTWDTHWSMSRDPEQFFFRK